MRKPQYLVAHDLRQALNRFKEIVFAIYLCPQQSQS
jgi:hypothetical protein